VPLIFDNPDDRTESLFDRLQAAATGNTTSGHVQISGMHNLYSVSVRVAPGHNWYHVGSPDDIVAAFKDWLQRS
jgi:hypothetical protein